MTGASFGPEISGLVGGTGTYAPIPTVGISPLNYGADPTGVADSTTAFTSAITAAKTVGVGVLSPSGTFLVTSSLAISFNAISVPFWGAGAAATIFNYSGTGQFLVSHNATYGSDPNLQIGPSFGGFTVRYTGSSSNVSAIETGDNNHHFARDIVIENFSGTGHIGWHWYNTGGSPICEENDIQGVELKNCTQNVVFDTGSFDYSTYDFHIGAAANQDGMVWINNSHTFGCNISVRGNFSCGVTNTGHVLWLGAAGSSDLCKWNGGVTNVSVECDGTGTGHQTLVMSNSSLIIGGYGTLNFLPVAGQAFAAGSVPYSGAFNWLGLINGDSTLNQMNPSIAPVRPKLNGFVGETIDPAFAATSQPVTTATHYVFRFTATTTETVSKVSLYASGSAGASCTNFYAAIYTTNGSLISGSPSSSDQGSNFNASGLCTANLGAATSLQAGVDYYISFWVGTAVTYPTFYCGANSGIANANLASGSGGKTSPRWGTAANAWSAGTPYTAPSTLGTITKLQYPYFAAVS